jgi:NAD(P)-dependent dehydrogenase (short-subunit alcohol dehydrogenase family)
MSNFQNKTALVIGGSNGVGRSTARALLDAGARVSVVARSAEGLERLRAETGGELQSFTGDAAEPAFVESLLRDVAPDLVVLAAGARPKLAPANEHSWESFSAPWNTDVKAAFHLGKAALELPLRPGSTVLFLSSGAAIHGSPLSGGYAGAKRMQWLLAGYLQKISAAKELGVRFVALLPAQLLEGTEIGAEAARAYGAAQGISREDFMRRFPVPLTADGVAAGILRVLSGEEHPAATALTITGKGLEALP